MEEKNNSFSFFQVFVSHYIRKNVVIPIVIAIRVAMNSATSSVILGYLAGKWKKQLILDIDISKWKTILIFQALQAQNQLLL